MITNKSFPKVVTSSKYISLSQASVQLQQFWKTDDFASMACKVHGDGDAVRKPRTEVEITAKNVQLLIVSSELYC